MQMGLDFIQENQYIIAPSEGDDAVETELFEKLEEKISALLANYTALKEENQILAEENTRLQQEREGLKGRVDAILSKLEGV
ncbi:MAG: cell division protein ZapB [Geobacter sp.]|nr:cell division protein ZapB [Geobacter sp.]